MPQTDAKYKVTLIIARHTESTHNVEDRYTGWQNPGLTARGLNQAQELGRKLHRANIKHISAVYVSELRRTTQTAHAVLKAFGQSPIPPIIPEARLNEVCMGPMDGMKKVFAREKYPGEKYRTNNPNFDFSDLSGGAHRGQSKAEVMQNHATVLRQIQTMHGNKEDEHVLLVGHGTSLLHWIVEMQYGRVLEQGEFLLANIK